MPGVPRMPGLIGKVQESGLKMITSIPAQSANKFLLIRSVLILISSATKPFRSHIGQA